MHSLNVAHLSGPESDSVSETLVEAQGLAKRFGDFVALQPLDVKVQSGEFFGVFGPNGAGKSTFIRPVSYTHLTLPTNREV